MTPSKIRFLYVAWFCLTSVAQCNGLPVLGALGVAQAKVSATTRGAVSTPDVYLGDVTISTNTTWPEDHYYINNLSVENGATLTVAGGSTLDVSDSLTVWGNSVLLLQGKNTGGLVDAQWQGVGGTINAGNVTVTAGSQISADGQGYTTGKGPGGATNAGASYGGRGSGASSGPTYGSPTAPVDLGSSGKRTGSSTGSSVGGGAIRLDVSGTLTLDGEITADGRTIQAHTYGGTGGSIWVTTDILTGVGQFTANGSAGTVSSTDGSGGGRIAVHYADATSFSGFAAAIAAPGGTAASAGTVGFFDTSVANSHLYVFQNFAFGNEVTLTYGAVTIDNGATFAIGGDATFTADTVTLDNASTLTLGGATTLNVTGNLTVQGDSVLLLQGKNTGGLVDGQWQGVGGTINAGSVTVTAGSKISADGQGYTTGNGPGGASNAGGSYGGRGSGAASGPTYGSPTAPMDLGSSGLRIGSSTGSSVGGGAIRLDVSGTLTLDGEISADGRTIQAHTYGGTGGSIWVTTDVLTGAGLFTANGSAGTVSTADGSGGGRIAAYYADATSFSGFAASTAAPGGTGVAGGGATAGTVFLRPCQAGLPEEMPLQLNKQAIGHLDDSNCGVQSWGFSAVAGQQIRLAQVNSSAPGLILDLTGPNGWIAFSALEGESGLINLPASGHYRLTASNPNGATDYSFWLEETAVTDLSSGNIYNGTFVGNSQAQLFRIQIPAGVPVQVVLDDSASGNFNELYLRCGTPPTRGEYDYRFDRPAEADQRIVIPMATPGTCYVLVYGDTITTPGSYTLLVETSGVLLGSVSPTRHGIGANLVLTLSGGGFDETTQVELVASAGARYAAENVHVASPTQMMATFAAGSVPVGIYSVVVSASGGASDQFPDAFEMTELVGAKLKTNLIVPSRVGYHALATIWVEYANEGDVAMRAPLLVVTATQNGRQAAILALNVPPHPRFFWTSAMPRGFSNTAQFLATGDTPGVLQPGESFRVPIQYAGWQQPWDFSYPPINFNLGVLQTDNTAPVDWQPLRDQMKPPEISPEAWIPMWANFVAQVGTSWGEYVTMLNDNAAYLSRLGQHVTEIGDLLAFEFAQAGALNVIPSLAAATDAYAPAPGIDLRFSRVFPQSINQRYALGALGRGWSHNWDMSLQVAADGTVTVLEPGGGPRVFQPDSRPGRGYFAMEGDHATLTALGGGAFSLQEQSGLLRVFRSDGKIDYVRDTNGNRVTAGYSGNQLMSLIHSAGQSVQFGYNASGCIATVIDPDGRQTSYSYDASGEHLLAVTYFDGSTIRYNYSSGAGVTREHALTQVNIPGGTHQYFAYDDRGRLASVLRDGDAETVSFAYDNAGMVAVVDAFGNRSEVYLDHRGLVVKTTDPLGSASHLDYDQQLNLATTTDPAGRVHRYDYDAQGRLVRAVDALGGATLFGYAGPFNHMTALTDAKGNVSRYAYDPAGDLTSITYPDGSAERWTYDAMGNPDSRTNRRNHGIGYEYDSDGRVIAKVLPGNVRIEYHYDTRGNLISALDPTGTTTLEYDTGDRLTKITYPGDRWLAYTYNAANQRASSLNQLGHSLDYQYDAVGRLELVTDETAAEIVRYQFDAAGRLQRKTLGNGVYALYEYDPVSQLTSLINYKPDASVLSRFLYEYDTRGRRTSMTTLEGRWDYTYDDLGQLIGWTDPGGRHVEYKYDPLGNRITVIDDGVVTPYTTNSLNQYTQVGDTTYQYDTDGNLVAKIAPTGTTAYAYDDENRLAEVSSPDGHWLYTYDAFGSRVRVDDNGTVTDFVVDPIGLGDVVGEYDHSSGAQDAGYNYGFDLLSREDAAGGQAAFYAFDAMGNTTELTGPLGSAVGSYSYLPFGESLSGVVTPNNPMRFSGADGVVAEANGLHYMRARLYDGTTGRFLSQDPIGTLGGVNLYAYGSNAPTDVNDPSGLSSREDRPGLSQTGTDWQGLGSLLKYNGETWDMAKDQWQARQGKVAWWYYIPPRREFLSGHYANRYVTKHVYDLLDNERIGRTMFGHDYDDIWIDSSGTHYWYIPARFTPSLETRNVPVPASTCTQSTDTQPTRPSDPNEKTGPTGYGAQHLLAGGSILPYRISFENQASAAVPAQVVTVTDRLDSDLDWATFELTEIGFGDVRLAVPPKAQHFETSVPMTFNGTAFEVQVEAGIHHATGEVYANFYTIDPSTGLPPPVDIGFLPQEDGTGRGDGYFAYVVNAKASLSPGTETRNVAVITFDYQETIATNQVDPHDPSKGTDPNKEALNTIAPDAATLTVASTLGGSVTAPGHGVFSYDWGDSVTLVAVADPGYEFVAWTGDISTIAAVNQPTTTLGLYDNFFVTASFAAVNCATSPSNPANGMFASCANTASGGTCALTCNTGYSKNGDALCTNGTWSTQICILADCPTNASGAPSCVCNDGYTGTLSWGGNSWIGACVDRCAEVACSASDECHDVGTCDTNTGLCSNPVKANGAGCDDGDVCTIADQCLNGVCTGNLNHCGDGVVQPSCDEECDNGTLSAGDGCTAACQLNSRGLACQRALGKRGRSLAVSETSLRQKCLDRVAAGTLVCQTGNCVMNPGEPGQVVRAATGCASNAECCPDHDAVDPTKTTATKLVSAEAGMANAIRTACSLAVGADKTKGTDDDTYIHPPTLGYDDTCLDTFGYCGSIPITTLAADGDGNDLIDCLRCTAQTTGQLETDFAYPLAAPIGTMARVCERAIGTQASMLEAARLSALHACLARVLNNKLLCQGGHCAVKAGSGTTLVPDSTCATASDCCPIYDAVNPVKTTAMAMTNAETTMVAKIRFACSTAVGADRKKGTADDTYIDPSALGFTGLCLSTFGQCGTLPVVPLTTDGSNNDLVECLQCTTEQAADWLVNFYFHRP